ncbi:thioredoxin family protein [Sulfurirhabdus autotrophica]|uniref:Thiol-disulfide isomerase/thioredoxin n=1 Tax=Sulfurirhabdus autotrophica TaxID=1706046 RepID=A0A4R3Y9C9_9PROT|nr:thioredoxin family protein [Sulfurirhabdus autotrophica]TCV88201.1 thiol-disulfide isomerase/thioredoxin [Sulfurirhabdus autotrophica]
MKLAQLFATAALALTVLTAQALEIQPYSPKALEEAQKANLPVALHFHADWCPTCRAQTKVLNSFKDDKSLNMTVLVVNYDKERDLKRKLGVRVQSTIIVYKGSAETARIAGETSPEKIKAALQSAL